MTSLPGDSVPVSSSSDPAAEVRSGGAEAGKDLPPAPPLRKLVGPGVIAIGIGLAAGEIVIWPYLAATTGLGLLWLLLLTLAVQVVINMEIERYTLATGETAVSGFSRMWKGWGLFFCVAGVFQYLWPGWATSASTVLTYTVGGGDEVMITVCSLVAMGAVLTVSKVIYQTIEKIEFFKIGATFVLLVVVAFVVLSLSDWGAAATHVVTDFGRIPEGVELGLLLSAMGAAGAGGVHNLVLSNWIRDKGYGMGVHAPRLRSPISGVQEARPGAGEVFLQTEQNHARWRVWWRRANTEHVVSFFGISVVTVTIMSLLAYSTVFGMDFGAEPGTEFLRQEGMVLSQVVGPWFQTLFLVVATVSLYAAAIGLLDVVGRLVSDVLKSGYLSASTFWTEGKLYTTVVWGEIVVGSAMLLAGLDEPLVLLAISTTTAAVVTLIYSVLLIRLNRRHLPPAIRMGGFRLAGMIVGIVFYAFFGGLVLVSELGSLFG